MTPGLRHALLGVGVPILLGVALGSILGGVVTGDPVYTVGWAIGIPVGITALVLLGSGPARVAGGLTPPMPGILSRATARPAPATAVLNPEPTVVPVGSEPAPVVATAPRPARRPPWRALLALALLVASAAVVLLPAYRMIGWTATNLAQGRLDGNDMRTGLHLQEAVDDLAAVVGGYDVVAVYFYDSYVLVEAPTTPGAPTTDMFQWRHGRAVVDGPYSGTVGELFDASRVDFSLIPELVAAAKAEAGWDGFTSWYPSVRADDGEPVITISLSNAYYSASFRYTIRGESIDRSGTGLEE